jgi:hypothetical protein
MIVVSIPRGEDEIVPILRNALRVSSLAVAAAVSLTLAPHAAADCTHEEWIDLCSQGGRSAGYPCVCYYMDDVDSSIDIDRPGRPPNGPDNSLPGAGRPGGGGGGPIIDGGGRPGGGGGRR